MKRKQAGGRLPATAALHEEEAGRGGGSRQQLHCMKRKQAGGRLPATAALHEEEAGSRQGGVLVQDVKHRAGGNGVEVLPGS